MAAEIMFRPDLIDIEVPGISESIFNCIQVSSDVTLTSLQELQELNMFRFQLLHSNQRRQDSHALRLRCCKHIALYLPEQGLMQTTS